MKDMIKGTWFFYIAITGLGATSVSNVIYARGGGFGTGFVVGGVTGGLIGSAAASSAAERRAEARSYYMSRDLQAANYELGIQNRKLIDENQRQREEIEALKARLRRLEAGRDTKKQLSEESY